MLDILFVQVIVAELGDLAYLIWPSDVHGLAEQNFLELSANLAQPILKVHRIVVKHCLE